MFRSQWKEIVRRYQPRFARGEGKVKRMIAVLIVAMAVPSAVHCASASHILARHLESVEEAESCIYGLKDSDGRGMDCLKLFQALDDNTGVCYGVYHKRSRGVFAIHLAQSTDLKHWKHIGKLDEHASQATVWPCENGGFLLAYEKDAPNSCWIRLRYYDDLKSLSMGMHAREYDVSRTLAPTAEGTPSFDSVELGKNGLDSSRIRLRFHYYKNAQVDQLARGTLTDFDSWKSEASDDLNADLIRRGWQGNLGDRDLFEWENKNYYLQETQRTSGDWSSWRLCLCDDVGKVISPLAIRTLQGASAFANPTATWITDSENNRKLVVTLFLLSEGNPSSEVGTMLYVINPSGTLRKTGNPLGPTRAGSAGVGR